MSASNYPAPTGAYKLVVTKGKGWQNYNHCRIQMSLNNAKYWGDKLFAILEWSSNRFDKVDFIFSDTLLRHNLISFDGITEEESYNTALELGRDWLNNNAAYFDTFKNIQIHNWDSLVTEAQVNYNILTLRSAYIENPSFKTAVNRVVQSFWARKKNNKGAYELFSTHGVNYVLEELAVFGFLFSEEAIDIYAGEWISECIEIISQDNILPSYTQAAYLEVDLVKNKGFISQQAA